MTRRPHFGKLSVRLAMMLAVALLPLSVVSLIQTRSLTQEAEARTAASLLGETLRAATIEIGTLREAQGKVSVMASVIGTLGNDTAACITVMREAVADIPTAGAAGFVREDGMMDCASNAQTYDFTDDPVFRHLVAQREPTFYVNPRGPVSGTSILGVSSPVFRDGTYLGYVGLSLRHDRLSQLDRQNDVRADMAGQSLISYWTFDANGRLLTAGTDLGAVSQDLPANRTLASFVGGPPVVFRDKSVAGPARTFALVPVIEGELYLMSTWTVPQTGWLLGSDLAAYLPTILMFTLGLMISAFASERLVSRHVTVLRGAIDGFTRGDRRLQDLDLRGAPDELLQLGDAYLAMTESVTRGEALLEDSAHQKEVLLREVHHRVKNNLQLISSIISIQMRRADSVEAKGLLKSLQDRVISLATIHRELYQTSGLADVRADELFPDIVRQIFDVSTAAEQRFDLDLDFDDLRLIPDQAVPLSLLLAEALTNALKHSGATNGVAGNISVRLKRLGGSRAVLEVVNARNAAADRHAAALKGEGGMGSQLMAAFALQIGGGLETETTPDSHRLALTFTVAPLAEGEDRTQTAV